jgi:hypothetical protein
VKRALFITCLCLLSAGYSSDKNKGSTPEQQTAAEIAELKQKIDHDSEREVCTHSADLVHVLVEQFNNQMNAGELQPAQQTLNDIETYSDKARDAAKNSHHKLKQAELTLHKSARRLADIAQALAVENRAAIEAAVKRIEAADDAILNQVFKN